VNNSLSFKAKEAMEEVVRQFKEGDMSDVIKVIKFRIHPDDNMPSAAWSLSNQVLAFYQSGGEIDCRGFKQWKSVGRKVKKGGSAVYILAPKTRRVEDASTGEDKVLIMGFQSIAVFPLHMTEGDPLPTFDYVPPQLPPLIEVAERLGVAVEWRPTHDGAYGWFSPHMEKIRVGTHSNQVFWHELAHAAHNQIERLKGGQDEKQEVVAEFTAAVLSEMHGEPYTGNAWNYIWSYSSDPLISIVKAISTVEKVLDVIFPEVMLEAQS